MITCLPASCPLNYTELGLAEVAVVALRYFTVAPLFFLVTAGDFCFVLFSVTIAPARGKIVLSA